MNVYEAFWVRDLLCCQLGIHTAIDRPGRDPVSFMLSVLGLRLDTGAWEMVVGGEEERGLASRDPETARLKCATPFELRPDLYL